jgi:hypothetical protein
MGLEPFATAYLYVCMLLAALPYCGFFAKDNHNQYILQYYSRASKNKVHMAKFITTFVSGGMIVLIPVLLNLIAAMMAVPALKPVENGLFIQSGSTMMGDLFYSHPFVFTFIYMWQFFLYGGAFSLVSLAVSFAFDNSFLVVISPFVTFYGIGVVSTLCKNLFNTVTFSPMALLAPSLILKDEGLFAFVFEPLIIAVVSCVVFFIKGAENEVL